MVQEKITVLSGKFNDYINHVDLKEFGTPKVLSSFIAEFDDCSLIFDCGTSFEIRRLLRYAKRNEIPLSSIKYLITSHHHFDHNGGIWKLYDIIKDHNPDVKILTNAKTQILLNNYEVHFNRAKRTFGDFVGQMKPIENKAFKIIKPISDFNNDLSSFKVIDTFKKKGNEIKLVILDTPGHTPDHQCPLFIKNGEIDFIFYGEAAGTLYHSSKLITTPTSMPIYFNYETYMETFNRLKLLKPNNVGYCHFGVVQGRENINTIMDDHENFMREFRNRVIKAYEEKPETKHVFERILPFYLSRIDFIGRNHSIMHKVILALVYGMMISLGYRKN